MDLEISLKKVFRKKIIFHEKIGFAPSPLENGFLNFTEKSIKKKLLFFKTKLGLPPPPQLLENEF